MTASTIIHPETIADGFTQSELTTLDQCGYKWNLAYNLRLKKIGELSWPLMVGNAWHETMEEMYATKGKRWTVAILQFPDGHTPSIEDEAAKEHWQGIVQTLAEEYAKYHKDDFQLFEISKNGIEFTADVTVEIEGIQIRLIGKLDLIGKFGRKRIGIMDHKTAGRITEFTVMGWDFKFQFMFYLWLYKMQFDAKAHTFVVNAIKKPELRQAKTENLISFTERCKTDIRTRPDIYFQRYSLDLTSNAMEKFEEEILMPKLYRLAMLQTGTPQQIAAIALNKNTDACHAWNRTCSYFPICQHGLAESQFQYETKPRKHIEISEE